MCAVFPFGDYDGGNLKFPHLGYEFEMRPGDLIMFKSWELLHGNQQSFGQRSFCVLVVHLLFKTSQPKDTRFCNESTHKDAGIRGGEKAQKQ